MKQLVRRSDEEEIPMFRRPKLFLLTFALCLALSAPAAAVEVKGKIKSIAVADNQFILTDDDSKDWTVYLDDDAKIELNGKKCKLADLKEGDRITIVLKKREDKPGDDPEGSIKGAPDSKDAGEKKDKNQGN